MLSWVASVPRREVKYVSKVCRRDSPLRAGHVTRGFYDMRTQGYTWILSRSYRQPWSSGKRVVLAWKMSRFCCKYLLSKNLFMCSLNFDAIYFHFFFMCVTDFSLNLFLCVFISRFLSGQSVAVVVKAPCFTSVDGSILQGSILSPILFLLFIYHFLS